MKTVIYNAMEVAILKESLKNRKLQFYNMACGSTTYDTCLKTATCGFTLCLTVFYFIVIFSCVRKLLTPQAKIDFQCRGLRDAGHFC